MKTRKLSTKFHLLKYEDKNKFRRLYVRLSEGRNNRIEFNTGIKLIGKYWDGAKGELSNKHPEYSSLVLGVSEWKKKMNETWAKYQSDKNFDFTSAVNLLSGRQNADSLDNYVETWYKSEFDKTKYTNTRNRLNGFKNLVNIKRPLLFEDVTEPLIKRYRNNVDKLIKKEVGSITTYQAYLTNLLSICTEAYENRDIKEEIKIAKKFRTFKKQDYGANASNSAKELSLAINNCKSIYQWEAIAQWILMFGLRGLYPADIVTLGENTLMFNSGNGKRTPFVKPENIFENWRTGNMYLDFKRAKTGVPMFINLNRATIELIEKLKYSYMYSHADVKFGNEYIVSDVNNRLNIISYDVAKYPNKHHSLWRNRGKLLKQMKDILPFKYARKTYYQIAEDESDELTAKKLVGHVTNRLSSNFYSQYNTEKNVKKLEKAHNKVLQEFGYNLLVSQLIKKFHSLIEEGKAPKWLLKNSAVFKEGDKWKVITGYKNNKPKYETIPDKYKRFLNDKSLEDDYWVTPEEKPLVDTDFKKHPLFEKLLKETKEATSEIEKSLEVEEKTSELQAKLDEAVKEEEYEKAAKYKTEIKQLLEVG